MSQPIQVYARLLKAGEVPETQPGNMVPLHVDSEGKLMVSASLTVAGDINIGSVTLKDADNATQAKVVAAADVKGGASAVLLVQQVDDEGNVLRQSAVLAIDAKLDDVVAELQALGVDTDAANILLTSIDTKVGATNTLLGTVNNWLDTIDTDVKAGNSSLETLVDNMTTVLVDLGLIKTKLDTANTNLGTINTSIGSSNTKLDTMIADLSTIISTLAALTQLNTRFGEAQSGVTPLIIQGKANAYPIPTSFAPSLVDQFGRLRVSNPYTLFDSLLYTDKQLEKWQELTTLGGTSTHGGNEPAVLLATTTTAGSRAVRQSYRYISYQPGKSKICLMTGVLNTQPKDNCRSRIGIFDNAADKSVDTGIANGLFFQLSGLTLSVVRRSSVSGSIVDTVVNQANWNIDKMDGTGISGVTLDVTKSQIFVIDLEYLGVGSVTFGLVVNRVLYYVHQFAHANVEAGPYMRRAALPVRYEIENLSTTSGASTMKQICCAVLSEGGFEPNGDMHTANRGVTTKTVSTAETPLLAIRLRSEYNRATLALLEATLMATGNDNMLLSIYGGPGLVLTGASWVDVDSTYSFAQVDVSTTSFTGGIKRYSQYMSTTTRMASLKLLGEPIWGFSDIAGNSIPILIVAQVLTGTGPAVVALNWQEFQ